ncbi:hypothetical protein GGR50DRAFT_665830 [Xylaria sp. CBS 124048]|nr:hypothetical protein GGR50DRAFT_665830 [Xylaria sp. CBS 124048]
MYNQGKIIKRLLGRHDNDVPSDSGAASGSSIVQSYRPNASQDADYPASVPIAYVDRTPDGRIAVLGGRHILKTIHIDGVNISEGIDVRAAISSQSVGKSNAATIVADQLSIKDVKIATHHGAEPTIFTACANGKIFMYDINRLASGLGLEFIQSTEGSRQVNKLDFNPHRGTFMLSGGQDGIVRCFDVKAPIPGRNGPTFRTFQAFRSNAEGIRDLKWAPKDGMIFACATESGAILKWDIRKPSQPLLKINAHDPQKGVSSISWHPDGVHLMSSGLDAKCYVWDLSPNAEKRQKPKWIVNCPAPVTTATWRPGLWSATAQGRRAAQVAVSYDEGGALKRKGITCVHIWDLARATMPYKEIDVFESSPSALLWHDRDLLWAVGQDGFSQCDVAFAPKVMDRQPLSSVAFSARGEALMFLQERVQPSRPHVGAKPHNLAPTSSYSPGSSAQMLSISRSDSEEDVIGSFLGPKRRVSTKRKNAHRPAHSLSTTPPSGPTADDQSVISLDQAIKVTAPFKPQQVMAIGHVPAATKVDHYHFLSRQYLEILAKDLPNSSGEVSLDKRVSGIMNKYARAAESAGQFRLAQTWRILSYAINLLLTSRSKYHLEYRLTNAINNESISAKSDDMKPASLHADSPPQPPDASEEESPNLVFSTESTEIPGRLRRIEEIDSESNVPTPLAGPVQDDLIDLGKPAGVKKLSPVPEIERFSLPPPTLATRPQLRRRLDSTSLSIKSEESQVSSTEGYDFYDVEAAEALPMAIGEPRRREQLNTNQVDLKPTNNRRKPVVRLDSDESFSPMFASPDTNRQVSIVGTSAEGARSVANRLRRQVSEDDTESDFSSRIRGRQFEESPARRKPLRRSIARQGSDTLTDDYMISQTTTDWDSDLSDIHLFQRASKSKPIPGIDVPARFLPDLPRPQDHTSPTMTETDFLPWDDDPPYPFPTDSDVSVRPYSPPIKPYEILSEAVTFESRRSALNASAMILLLKPLVPNGVIDSNQATAILRQHHSRLMGMKLFVEAALLRNLCLQGWPEGLAIWGEDYDTIFRVAQDRVSIKFACAHCHKSRNNNRSKTDGSDFWKCDHCRALVAPCAVCGHREAASEFTSLPIGEGMSMASSRSEDSILSTWWYCPDCSHGGHANCLQDWHAPLTSCENNDFLGSPRKQLYEDDSPQTNSDGCCPFDGCGHACLPGRWRNESSTARTEELGRAVREQYRGVVNGLNKVETHRRLGNDAAIYFTPAGSVREDTLEVPQSRAVESAREALAGNALGVADKPGGLMGILSSSPGRTGNFGSGSGSGERERRKSVKFARGSDERR